MKRNSVSAMCKIIENSLLKQGKTLLFALKPARVTYIIRRDQYFLSFILLCCPTLMSNRVTSLLNSDVLETASKKAL